ncbi:hypothetical protein AXG93_2369s1000 [Marchantia polymorpha subsp. ruderalis]|uniref:Uncharacterized protein n=1 Tax=Marchantia polymorpha subsp. ruderalis TaxID=1480154 RepID=A0A176W9X2_MARPO|nr:hypothetical protein AXG93_2369s1000 [Marchantia polymorpha subsp. ruderalis]
MLQSVAAKLDEAINLLKKRNQENLAEKIFAEPHDEHVTVDGDNGEKVIFFADSEDIGPIKKLLLNQLKKKYVLKALHAAIAYLDPLQKNRMKKCGFTQQLINQSHVYIKYIMRKVGALKQLMPSMSGEKRPLMIKSNHVKKPRSVVLNVGPNRNDSDDNESVEDHDALAKDFQLVALIDAELAEYRLLKVSKNDKVILLQLDIRERARSDGDIKHEDIKSTFMITTNAHHISDIGSGCLRDTLYLGFKFHVQMHIF